MIDKLSDTIYQQGVIVRISGNNLIMSPPLVIERTDVERILGALEAGLMAV
ncbi:MAG: hypothetical protein R3E89_13455 [Thiolinea sp.]